MQLAINVDTRALENSLYLLAKEARLEPGRVIKEEARLVTQNIIQLTPPKTYSQGRKAIAADLFGGRKVRRSQGGQEDSVGLLQKIGSSTQVPPRNNQTQTIGVRLGWEGSKKVRIMRKNWRPDASLGEIKAFHKRYQNAYGRSPLVSRSTIGRWKVQDQLWVKDSVANRYFRMLASRVGWARGSWAPALVAAGGRPSNWYGKHAAAAGTVQANFGENPTFTATARQIKIPGYQRVVDNAVRNRVRVTQTKIKRLIAGKATNLGFVTILDRA